MEPSIKAASEGVPLSEDQSLSLLKESEIKKFPSSMKIWGKDRNYKDFGDNVINQDLASTLNKISLCGSSAFYEG